MHVFFWICVSFHIILQYYWSNMYFLSFAVSPLNNVILFIQYIISFLLCAWLENPFPIKQQKLMKKEKEKEEEIQRRIWKKKIVGTVRNYNYIEKILYGLTIGHDIWKQIHFSHQHTSSLSRTTAIHHTLLVIRRWSRLNIGIFKT